MVTCTLDFSLRVLLAFCQLGSVLSGLMSALSAGWTSRLFKGHCLLYTNMTVDFKLEQPSHLTVDLDATSWGSTSVCDYVTYLPVIVTIYSIIWFWFFALLNNWHRAHVDLADTGGARGEGGGGMLLSDKYDVKDPPDARLLIPTLLFNLLLLVCVLFSLGFTSEGRRHWCNSIHRTLLRYGQDKSCAFTSQVTWTNMENDAHKAYAFLTCTVVGCWLTLISVCGTIVVLLIRLYYCFYDHIWEDLGPAAMSTFFGGFEEFLEEMDGGIANPVYEFTEEELQSNAVKEEEKVEEHVDIEETRRERERERQKLVDKGIAHVNYNAVTGV